MQIAIVLYQGVTALDAIGPYEVLRCVKDTEIRFISETPQPIVADSGVLVIGTTHSFEDTPTPDIVLVPGSSANTTTAMADEKLIKWLQKVHQTTKLTLSVCSGSLVLAAAGILNGHPATTHWVAQQMLKQFGAQPKVNERIVKSGKIYTAAGVSAGIDLALFIVKELHGQKTAESIQLRLEYDPQPPVDSGHPSKASKEVLEFTKEEMKKSTKNIKNLISVPKIMWQLTLSKVKKNMSSNKFKKL